MATAPRQQYPSDLTDAQWQLIEHFFTPPAQQPGPKAVIPRREILNAIFYLLREGCRWRSLPHEYPNWRTVNDCFRRWQQNGLLQQVYEELHRAERVRQGRTPQPTAGALDSQSVKTGACAREDNGYDAGKKNQGA
jgi:putative transposase